MKRNKVIGFLGVMIMVLGQCLLFPAEESGADKMQTVMEHYKKGLELHDKKDYNGFVHHLEKAIELLPNNKRLTFVLARGYALTGKNTAALKHLNHLVELGFLFEIETEKDFDGIRKDEAFRELMEKVKEGKKPVIASTPAFSIKERDLFPEGMAYDPVEKMFFVSSLSKCKVARFDENGKSAGDFAASRLDGLLATVGMRVDAERRILWVCSNYGYPNEALEKEKEPFGSAMVSKYDLKTGKLIKKYTLPIKEKHFLNDVALAPDGTAYLSDSHVPGVYRIDAKTDTIERLADFPDYGYPNGIVYSPETRKIFVACVNDVVVVDVGTGEVSTLAHPDNIYIAGSDGMYLYKNSLIGIQNSMQPERIVRMQLDKEQERVVKMTILESNNPDVLVPTTGVIAGSHFFFIANSQMMKMDNGKVPPLEKLGEIKILKIKLD